MKRTSNSASDHVGDRDVRWQEAVHFLNRISEDEYREYWAARLPCAKDEKITEICELYRQMSLEERRLFEKQLSQRGFFVLGTYSTRMAMLGAREKREDRLIYGIVALTIGWSTPYLDWRETLMALAPLYHSACIVGDPRGIFEAGVQHVEDEKIRRLILGFLDRDPRDQRLEVMGWEAIEGPSGLVYRFGSQPIPKGHL